MTRLKYSWDFDPYVHHSEVWCHVSTSLGQIYNPMYMYLHIFVDWWSANFKPLQYYLYNVLNTSSLRAIIDLPTKMNIRTQLPRSLIALNHNTIILPQLHQHLTFNTPFLFTPCRHTPDYTLPRATHRHSTHPHPTGHHLHSLDLPSQPQLHPNSASLLKTSPSQTGCDAKSQVT